MKFEVVMTEKSKIQIAKEWRLKCPDKTFEECRKLGMPEMNKQSFYDAKYRLMKDKQGTEKKKKVQTKKKKKWKNPELVEGIEKFVQENKDGDLTPSNFYKTSGLKCIANFYYYHRRRVLKGSGKTETKLSSTVKDNALMHRLFAISTEGKSQETVSFAIECMNKLGTTTKLKLNIREMKNPDEIEVRSLKSV